MKKLGVLALLLLPTLVAPQVQYPDSPSGGGGTYDGGPVSNPILLPDGGWSFTNDTDMGCSRVSGILTCASGASGPRTLAQLFNANMILSLINGSAQSTAITLGDGSVQFKVQDVQPFIISAGAGSGGFARFIDTGTRPTCSSTFRGGIWVEYSGASTADTVEVCAKTSTDTYAWHALASIP